MFASAAGSQKLGTSHSSFAGVRVFSPLKIATVSPVIQCENLERFIKLLQSWKELFALSFVFSTSPAALLELSLIVSFSVQVGQPARLQICAGAIVSH